MAGCACPQTSAPNTSASKPSRPVCRISTASYFSTRGQVSAAVRLGLMATATREELSRALAILAQLLADATHEAGSQ